MPDKKWATFSRAFKMVSVKVLELESAFGFLVALLVSLATLKYLALSNADLDVDEEIHLTSPCDVALEGLYLGGVSPRVIKPSRKLSQIPLIPRPHYAGWRRRQCSKKDLPRQWRS